MTHESHEKEEYLSYNALDRTPMMPVLEVPYMFSLISFSSISFIAMLVAVLFSPWGWLLVLLEVPIVFFAKLMCETDDRALSILALEVKWLLIRFFQPSSVKKFFGGTLTFLPIDYSNQHESVEELHQR